MGPRGTTRPDAVRGGGDTCAVGVHGVPHERHELRRPARRDLRVSLLWRHRRGRGYALLLRLARKDDEIQLLVPGACVPASTTTSNRPFTGTAGSENVPSSSVLVSTQPLPRVRTRTRTPATGARSVSVRTTPRSGPTSWSRSTRLHAPLPTELRRVRRPSRVAISRSMESTGAWMQNPPSGPVTPASWGPVELVRHETLAPATGRPRLSTARPETETREGGSVISALGVPGCALRVGITQEGRPEGEPGHAGPTPRARFSRGTGSRPGRTAGRRRPPRRGRPAGARRTSGLV